MDYEPPRGSFSRKWKKIKLIKFPTTIFDTLFFSPDHILQRRLESEFQNKSTKNMIFLFYFPLPTCVLSLKIFLIPAPHGFWDWRKNVIILVFLFPPNPHGFGFWNFVIQLIKKVWPNVRITMFHCMISVESKRAYANIEQMIERLRNRPLTHIKGVLTSSKRWALSCLYV